jgi:hypothetical protein
VRATCVVLVGFVIGAAARLRLLNRKEKAVLITAAQEEINARQVYGDPVHD